MRLFRRVEGSPRRFRHDIYTRIAEGEPAAWATCGTPEQRATAIKDPSTLPQGSRPAKVIVDQWNAALAAAFGGLELTHVRGKQSGDKPLGYWTTELKTID